MTENRNAHINLEKLLLECTNVFFLSHHLPLIVVR